jgi:hypothetical protein
MEASFHRRSANPRSPMMVKGFGAGKAAICLLPKRFDTTNAGS